MRTIYTISLAALAGAFTLTPMHADEWDKKTIITINAPVEIPSTTLQPGTYTFKLLESNSNRHVVTVWDKDERHLVTTIIAIPNYRLKPTGKTKISFWETSAGQPTAMRAWFYPGDNFGQEFAYPKAKAQELSKLTNSEVPAMTGDDESKYGGAKSTETASTTPAPAATEATAAPGPEANPNPLTTASPEPTPAPAPAPVEAAPAPTPAPEPPATPAPAEVAQAPAPEPAPAPAPTTAQADQTPAPASMPQTASNWNETLTVGFLLALAGLSTFALRAKRS